MRSTAGWNSPSPLLNTLRRRGAPRLLQCGHECLSPRLDLATVLLLTTAPLLWAGNTIVGRLAAGWIPPMTFNLLRWSIALLVLLPLSGRVLRRSSPLWRDWQYFALLGLLAIAGYNSLQYLALHTSSALNVTLVAASMPVWMLLVGRIGFGAPVTARAMLGAALSLGGVLVVLAKGQLERLLQLQFVPGDGWILLAAFSWAWYSWLLTRRRGADQIRQDWAAFPAGADRVRSGLVRAADGWRMAAARTAASCRVELEAGRGTAVRRAGAGADRLPLLGAGVGRAGPTWRASSAT